MIQKETCDVSVINCITGTRQTYRIRHDSVECITYNDRGEIPQSYVGPGLIDLQINGINGIDFNTPLLTPQHLADATEYLLGKGVTTFFPTVITNADENILQIVQTINAACSASPFLDSCIGGIHLEGPFISPVEGAKGAHDKKYIKAPDWELFQKFQQAAGGRIKIITLSPEWERSPEFINNCHKQGIIISIGHSMANTGQIKAATKAGARLSTHLGNGIPLLLPRHPNQIWDQLAEDDLYTSIIGDGIHVPDSFLRVVMKVKGDHTILVSDATRLAGMPPGEYQDHIGGIVILNREKKISIKNSPGILAGAAKSLLENVEYLYFNKLASLSETWKMASTNAGKMLAENSQQAIANTDGDLVMFRINEKEVAITRVIKNGRIVFEP